MSRLYEEGVVVKMEELQYHENDNIYELVAHVLAKFFTLVDGIWNYICLYFVPYYLYDYHWDWRSGGKQIFEFC